MRIVFCGNGWLSIVDRIRARLPPGLWIRVRDFEQPLVESVRHADVIIPSNARIDAEVLDAATNVRLVQQLAAGYDGIDLEAARARSIPVCNAPGLGSASVAETALMLMLMLAKRYPSARRAFAERKVGVPVGLELETKVLGVIGLGATGSRLVRSAEALGMRVLSVKSASSRADLDRLFGFADIVSVHCPLTDETRGLVDARALSLMKRGALLVNCARGAILDRDAVIAALDSGHLGGLGLDVHWEEPADPADPLYTRDDVVALPHIAGSTEEAFERLISVLVENVSRAIAGKELLHRLV